MCSGVVKSGSPRLKSKTPIPSAFSCLALAPAARVADGCTAAAILEIGIITKAPPGVPPAHGRLFFYLTFFAGGRQRGRNGPQGGAPFRAAFPPRAGGLGALLPPPQPL